MDTMKNFYIDDDLQEAFEAYFGEVADVYWRVFRDRWFYACKYAEIADKYSYSVSSIKRIIKLVEDFFNNPAEKIMELECDFDDLTGMVNFPTAFEETQYTLSLGALKLLIETIYLYQHDFPQKIPRSHMLRYASQYKNLSRRTKAFDELRKLQVTLPDGKCIRIYDEIKDEKGAMHFRFTEDALEYVDLRRRFEAILDAIVQKKER